MKYTLRAEDMQAFQASTAASVQTFAPESCPALSLTQPRVGEHTRRTEGAGAPISSTQLPPASGPV